MSHDYDTGIDMLDNTQLSVTTSVSYIHYSPPDATYDISPDGYVSDGTSYNLTIGSQQFRRGSLLGRIESKPLSANPQLSNKYFYIGTNFVGSMLGYSGRLFLSLHDDSCALNTGKLTVQVVTSKIGEWYGGTFNERVMTQLNGDTPVQLPSGLNMQRLVPLDFSVGSSTLSLMLYSEAQQGPDISRQSVWPSRCEMQLWLNSSMLMVLVFILLLSVFQVQHQNLLDGYCAQQHHSHRWRIFAILSAHFRGVRHVFYSVDPYRSHS